MKKQCKSILFFAIVVIGYGVTLYFHMFALTLVIGSIYVLSPFLAPLSHALKASKEKDKGERWEYSVDGKHWTYHDGESERVFGLPFSPSSFPYKRVRDLSTNVITRVYSPEDQEQAPPDPDN